MIPHIIEVPNVNQALPDALWFLKTCGVASESRNGPVVVAPGPVLTVYYNPTQRVLFSAKRDANPFMHFFEALWMLAGRNDTKFVSKFTSNLDKYSDDGKTLNGAYGYRWRKRWFDQIETVIEHLKTNPTSRREVIAMWTAGDLLDQTSLDLPCNSHIYVDIREGKLNITVCNRSNDMVLGAYGANVVHMSMLHEFLARAVGVPIGTYIQFSNNAHIYKNLYNGDRMLEHPSEFEDFRLYPSTYPMIQIPWELWLEDVESFVEKGHAFTFRDPLFNEVATPMMNCWGLYKAGELREAIKLTLTIKAEDWQIACQEWLERRVAKEGGTIWRF